MDQKDDWKHDIIDECLNKIQDEHQVLKIWNSWPTKFTGIFLNCYGKTYVSCMSTHKYVWIYLKK